MLKNIPQTITPELLMLLSRMGEGDELLICGANYPVYGMGIANICHVNCPTGRLLSDILALFPLSGEVIPATMYFEEDGESAFCAEYERVIAGSDEAEKLTHIDRLDKYPFLNRAEKVYCAVVTCELAAGSELILTKGRV